LIALDWGLSAFRAFRLGADGSIVERRSAQAGILTIADSAFEAALLTHLADWLASDPGPIVAAGMIGSRQGWVEAPYVACPATIVDLAGQLQRATTERAGEVWFVPGARWSDGTATDVMRGEETQIVGALADRALDDAVLCLPGTHCKWAVIANGRIERFRTYMTGELFAVLRQHSILGRLMHADVEDDDAFHQGLDRAAQAGGLLHHLFSARTAGLFAHIAEPALASYLSGLLIGDEIVSAVAALGAATKAGPILLVGAPALCRRYAAALAHRGLESVTLSEDMTARGVHRIARAAGLVG
jgi:2-dehydro-3-deoxygalactonokinase